LLVSNYDVYDKEKTKKFISHIYSSSINTFNLLENFLDWAKVRLNKISFSKEIIDFSQSYKEVTDNLNIIAQNKGINIECQAEDGLKINADVFMFKTILRNLLSNAIKFSSPNTAVKVSAEIKDKDILFTIFDTGIGIPKEICDQLFNNSKVVPGIGTNNEKGTGLGLWLCNEFITQHGGKIWVESEVGKGSKFMFTIPCI
jgi:signal transduction histidine kinase